MSRGQSVLIHVATPAYRKSSYSLELIWAAPPCDPQVIVELPDPCLLGLCRTRICFIFK